MRSKLHLLLGAKYRALFLGLLCGWTLVCLLFLAYLWLAKEKEQYLVASSEALTATRKDLAYRRWAAQMGGLYVDVGRIQPNPYLKHLPERDVHTDKGQQLTLVNPAYMTRMVQESSTDIYGAKSHLTSLNPLRPGNAADDWEAQALRRLQAGEQTVTELVKVDGRQVLRHMTSFVTEESCLKCHASQGYKVGDQRGGISVTIPYDSSWYTAMHGSHHGLLWALVLLWSCVSAGIVVLCYRLAAATSTREQAQALALQREQEANAAISEREARLQGIVSRLQAAYFSLDAEGRYTDVNEAWLKMHGYENPEEILGKTCHGVLPEDMSDFVDASIRALMAGKSVRMDLNRHRRKDGSIGYHAVSAIPLLRGGLVVGVDGFLIDLSELYAAKADTDRLLSEMVEAFALNELVCNAQGEPIDFRIIQANAAFSRLLTLPPAQFLGKSAKEVFPGVEQGLIRQYAEVVRTGASLSLEYFMPSLGRFLSIRAYRPKPGFFACTFIDNTENRRAREALERDEAELFAVYNQAPVMMAVVDRQRRIRRVNRALSEFVGHPESELPLIKVGPLLGCIHSFDVPSGCGQGPQCSNCEVRRCVADTLEHGVTHRRHEARVSLEREKEQLSFILLLSTAMLHLGEEPVALICIEDITTTRRLESQVLRMQRLESLGSLATGVAHDLNNILVPIMMSVDLLAPLATEPEMQNMIQLLRSSSQRGAGLLKQLLLFGRGAEVHRCETQPVALIEEISRLIRETFPKNISFKCEAPEGLRGINVDPTQIHQVLLNLCVNARDAMPRGGLLSIKAALVELGADASAKLPGTHPGPHVCFSISDTGQGIPAEIIDNIFDPFFTTKPVGQGTGLGLSTVQGIVGSHEGAVVVESAPGKGTSFHVYLPASRKAQVVEAVDEDLRCYEGQGQLILVVDDEESIRKMMHLGLSSYGYRVIDASDGATSLALFSSRADEIDLIICDLMMPHMDGRAALECIRSIRKSVPLIAISGVVHGSNGLQQITGAPVKLLQKPFELGDLLRLVHQVLVSQPR